MTTYHRNVRAWLCLAFCCLAGTASAQTVRVVVDVEAEPKTGGDALSRALRRGLADRLGPLVPSKEYGAAHDKLGLKGSKAVEPAALARAARSVQAEYVVRLKVRKKGKTFWLRARLINAADAATLLDFEDTYPKADQAEGMGGRVSQRVLAELERLGRLKPSTAPEPPVAVAPFAGAPGELEPVNEPSREPSEPSREPPPAPVATESVPVAEPAPEPAPEPEPEPELVATQSEPRWYGPADTTLETEAEPPPPRRAPWITLGLGAGLGLARSYQLTAPELGRSSLSHALDPVPALAGTLTLAVPGVGLTLRGRGGYRPVTYRIDAGDLAATPGGSLIDLEAQLAWRFDFGSVSGAPYGGVRGRLANVDEHTVPILPSATTLAVTGGGLFFWGPNPRLDFVLGLEAAWIASYNEQPARTGASRGGWGFGLEQTTRIWLSDRWAFSVDHRLTVDTVGFQGAPTRPIAPSERGLLRDARLTVWDLYSAIGATFRY